MGPKPQKPKTGKQITTNDTFLEMLRDLGGQTAGVLKNDLVGEIPNEVLVQTGLKPRSPQETLYSQVSREELIAENESLRKRLWVERIVHREEKIVFSAKKQETQARVKLLQEEAAKLTKEVKNLDEKIEIAATAAPVEVGTYHISFFEKLIHVIRSITQKVSDASTWLSLTMVRGKRRSYYWGQVQKSGSKYLLSQERYMATQAG